mmetsp:Transcript_34865/g.75273  ORF Transcript_34865/g.75273 Transcript_34865/m.75273 type:complete len:112 (+) Transcript_34865:254-589(+)
MLAEDSTFETQHQFAAGVRVPRLARIVPSSCTVIIHVVGMCAVAAIAAKAASPQCETWLALAAKPVGAPLCRWPGTCLLVTPTVLRAEPIPSQAAWRISTSRLQETTAFKR